MGSATLCTQRPAPLRLAEGQPTTLLAPHNGTLLLQCGAEKNSIRIEWSQGRAKVCLDRADLTIARVADFDLHCDTFRVSADQALTLQSHGSINATASTQMNLSAQELSLRATLGDLWLRANDFVRAVGEKILLNTDVDPERSRQDTQRFLQRILGYSAKEPKE